MSLCASCGDRQALPTHDLCSRCDDDALRDDWPVHQPAAPDAPIPGRHWYGGCEPGGDWDSETGQYDGQGPRVDPETGVCSGCGEIACPECGAERYPDGGCQCKPTASTTTNAVAVVSSLAFTPSIVLLYACLALAATLLAAAFYLVLRDLLGDEGWPMLDEARREIAERLKGAGQ